jgi:integrase
METANIEAGKMLTKELLEEWEQYRIEGRYPLNTIKMYYSFIKRYIERYDLITQQNIERYRNKYPSTVCASAIKDFVNYLVDVRGFPLELKQIYYSRKKVIKKDKIPLKKEEAEKIINLFLQEVYKENVPLTSYFLTKFIYITGIRISEALHLRWKDVNWEEWLRDKTKQSIISIINSKRGKTRRIPCPSRFTNEIYSAHQQRNENGVPIGGLVFDFDISLFEDPKKTEEQVQYDYTNYSENLYRHHLEMISVAAIERKVTPHIFRHMRATDMMNSDVPIETIKEFLGHESIVSTQIYAKTSPEKLQRDLEKYQEKGI